MGLFDQEVVTLLYGLIKDSKEARVTSLTTKQKTKAPPLALHTVELLRVASSKLHIGPKQAMEVAERLYVEVGNTTQGVVTNDKAIAYLSRWFFFPII